MKKLSVKNLKKQYGSYEAVKGISFELGEGECLGILGINGAGKTSTLKMIYSLTSISSGEIDILGQNIETNRRKSKSCLGIVGQEDMLDMTLNVYDNLLLTVYVMVSHLSNLGRESILSWILFN